MQVVQQQGCGSALFENVSWRWILTSLYAPSIGLVLFAIGLTLMFILPILFPTFTFESKSYMAKSTYAAACLLLAASGACEMLRGGMWSVRHQVGWVLLTCLVIFYLFVRGIIEGTDLYLVVRNAGTFIVFLTLPAIAVHRDNWPWLFLLFIVHSVFAMPAFYYLLITHQLTSRDVSLSSESRGFVDNCLYTAALLFLMLPVLQNRGLRLLAILLFATGLLDALLAGKRGPFLHSAVMVCILVFIMLRTHGIHHYLTRVFPKAVMIYGFLLIVGVLGISTIINPRTFSNVREVVTSAYQDMEVRMTQFGSTNEMIMKNERWIEIDAVVASMSTMDWISGKGLAGIWSSSDFAKGEERNMVHNTWLLCFFWGGVGLFLVVLWPLIWALRVILFSKSTAAMCCAGFVLLTYWKFPFYDISKITLGWIVFCVMIGVCRWEIVAMRNRSKGGTASMNMR
jgi:hypothetical protein